MVIKSSHQILSNDNEMLGSCLNALGVDSCLNNLHSSGKKFHLTEFIYHLINYINFIAILNMHF